MTSIRLSTMTPEAARALTDEVKVAAAELWSKLLQLYEGGAHTALGYSSWGAYYEAEFNESGNYGYRLLKSAQVMEQLPIGNSRPASEAVARELVPVLRDDPEQVEEVWAEVVEEHGPAPTAAQVREHVQTTGPTRRRKDPRRDPRRRLGIALSNIDIAVRTIDTTWIDAALAVGDTDDPTDYPIADLERMAAQSARILDDVAAYINKYRLTR